MLDDVLPDVWTEAAKRDHEGLLRGNVQLLSDLLDGSDKVVCGLRGLLPHLPQIGSTFPGVSGAGAIAVNEGVSQFCEVALNIAGLGVIPYRRAIFQKEWERPEF